MRTHRESNVTRQISTPTSRPASDNPLALQRLAGNQAVTALMNSNARELSVQRYIFLGHSLLKPSGAIVTSPGCAVTWNNRDIRLSGRLQTYGPNSSPEIAAQIKATIEKQWKGGPFEDGSSIAATASVEHRDESTSADGDRSQIHVTSTNRPSNVHRYYYNPFGQYTMDLNLFAGQGDTDWTPAHEFGHMVGLPDHYTEPIASKIRSLWGGHRDNTIDNGWDGNIMAVDKGMVDKRNTGELLDLYAKEFVLGPNEETTAANAASDPHEAQVA